MSSEPKGRPSLSARRRYRWRALAFGNDKKSRLIAARPRETLLDPRRFEMLKRPYVDVRYSASYEISSEDVAALTKSVRASRDIVERVSRQRLEALRQTASG